MPSVQPMAGAPSLRGEVRATTFRRHHVYMVVKRGLDLVLASLLLVTLLPLFLIVAVLIKVDSPGPVFYLQRRVGLRGHPFSIVKFRSMRVGADREIPTLLPRNDVDGPLFKLRNDPRVTRVGRLLRRTSIDELPQLINVVLGQMSLVGPRPPLAHEVAQYTLEQRGRLEVIPGLTGLWQVSGRSDLPFELGIRLDLYYVEHLSLLLDLQILIHTIPAVIRTRGAY